MGVLGKELICTSLVDKFLLKMLSIRNMFRARLGAVAAAGTNRLTTA